MTTVLVTGGSGNLGGHVVQQLLDSGSDVRIASRRLEPSGWTSDAVWAAVDYRTRAGLAAALAGADVAVHCAGGSAKGEAETIAALLSSAKRAGLAHLVYISIVGVDKLPMGYYRAKLAAERALIASGIPWTILRATQFHDLAFTIVRTICRPPIGVAPKGVSCQPVAVQEVAGRLAELATGPPAGRVPELGGPAIIPLTELARMYLRSADRKRRVVAVPMPGRLIRGLRAGYGLTPDHGDGIETFADYLRARSQSA